jgi:hypothetical protein
MPQEALLGGILKSLSTVLKISIMVVIGFILMGLLLLIHNLNYLEQQMLDLKQLQL